MNEDPGFGTFTIRIDQQHRNIVMAQFQIMSIVPRLFGPPVHPNRDEVAFGVDKA